jgi:hypothetical protein
MRRQHHGKVLKSATPLNVNSDNKSWRAPLTILLTLAVGFGFALAHHEMGSHLNHKPIDEIWISQAWISRFGTGLAFLVKMTLAIGVGSAYVQRQWMHLHLQSFKIAEVDALTTVLGNAFNFCSSGVWFRYPMLTFVALLSWSVVSS